MIAMNVNRLRDLIASGAVSEADLRDVTISGGFGQSPSRGNALASALSDQEVFANGDQSGMLPMGSMRNEQTGRVTYFNPGAEGYSDQPYPARAQIQRPRTRVVGMGGGKLVDLGEEDARAMPVDYTRPGLEIAGLGKGYYTADGRFAVIANPDGSMTKVVLGYDAEGSDRANARRLALARAEAEIKQTQEQTEASRQARIRNNAVEIIPGAGISQQVLERQYGKPPEGMRWADNGTLADIPGSGDAKLNKATEDERRSAGLAVRMNNAITSMNEHPKGERPQVLPEALRSIPLVGEAAANVITPYERQTVEAAQLDALDAALTLATGAAYTKEQLKGLSKSYFPQLGDDEKTMTDKRARLVDVINTARIRAGRAAGTIDAKKDGSGRIEADALPMAHLHPGKMMTDTKTGLRYRSDGNTWVRQ